jgi:hypothetical protein
MEEPQSSISARHSRYQVSPSDFDLVALAGRGAFGKVMENYLLPFGVFSPYERFGWFGRRTTTVERSWP